jgi:uncharacterized protein
MATGETNLAQLLKGMRPVLNPGGYVFCTVTSIEEIDKATILSFFKEAEGYTLILSQHQADKLQLPYTCPMAWISLTVHSSLEAVGLTAAFSNALANANISCNTVAAFYHDHIFVPHADADRAMDTLLALTASTKENPTHIAQG